jgi:hypothetical protein
VRRGKRQKDRAIPLMDALNTELQPFSLHLDWPDMSFRHMYTQMGRCMLRCWSFWLLTPKDSDGWWQLR